MKEHSFKYRNGFFKSEGSIYIVTGWLTERETISHTSSHFNEYNKEVSTTHHDSDLCIVDANGEEYFFSIGKKMNNLKFDDILVLLYVRDKDDKLTPTFVYSEKNETYWRCYLGEDEREFGKIIMKPSDIKQLFTSFIVSPFEYLVSFFLPLLVTTTIFGYMTLSSIFISLITFVLFAKSIKGFVEKITNLVLPSTYGYQAVANGLTVSLFNVFRKEIEESKHIIEEIEKNKIKNNLNN